jgi:hypothetical protein
MTDNVLLVPCRVVWLEGIDDFEEIVISIFKAERETFPEDKYNNLLPNVGICASAYMVSETERR